jgi:hypothetical protein
MNTAPETVRIVGFYGTTVPAHPERLSRSICEWFDRFGRETPRVMAMTQLASPAELLFAREMLALRIPLVALLSAAESELQKTASPESWKEIDAILRGGARVEIARGESVKKSAWHRLVEEVDVLLVSYDGKVSLKEDRLIQHARRMECEVVLIDERSEAPATAEAGLPPPSHWPELDFRALLNKLKRPAAEPGIPGELVTYAQACNVDADRIAPAYRKYYLNIVLANAVAAVAGTVNVVFAPPTPPAGFQVVLPGGIHVGLLEHILVGIKFGCVALGLGIYFLLQVRKSQSHWINARLKAEMCRSAMATWPRMTDALAMAGQAEARATLRFLRYVHTVHALAPLPLDDFKAHYAYRRLWDQFHYYRKQGDRAAVLSRRLKPLYWIFSALSILCAIASLVYPYVGRHHHGQAPQPGSLSYYLLGFIPIMAPSFASWILSWDAIETLGRRKARYREMESNLHRQLGDLLQADSEEAVDEVVERTEKMLLSEVLEWYSFIKYSK